MDLRICPNCGESCEKEFETVIVLGHEYCACCNYSLEQNFREDILIHNYMDDNTEKNNAFIDFFNDSGLLESQKY